MAVEKFKASGTSDVMKTDDRIDTILRQAVGREPLFYFPRANESPVQWVPLLHAFDPQGVSNSYTGMDIYIFGGSCSQAFRRYHFVTLGVNWIKAFSTMWYV